jgi:hypothetical protein
MPLTITLEQVEGLALWALRAVINGRGDELIEVTESNFGRRDGAAECPLLTPKRTPEATRFLPQLVARRS